jgi:hypothetical protein
VGLPLRVFLPARGLPHDLLGVRLGLGVWFSRRCQRHRDRSDRSLALSGVDFFDSWCLLVNRLGHRLGLQLLRDVELLPDNRTGLGSVLGNGRLLVNLHQI